MSRVDSQYLVANRRGLFRQALVVKSHGFGKWRVGRAHTRLAC